MMCRWMDTTNDVASLPLGTCNVVMPLTVHRTPFMPPSPLGKPPIGHTKTVRGKHAHLLQVLIFTTYVRTYHVLTHVLDPHKTNQKAMMRRSIPNDAEETLFYRQKTRQNIPCATPYTLLSFADHSMNNNNPQLLHRFH